MWDLNTINRINQAAARQARAGLPEREALYIATGTRDPHFQRIPAPLPEVEVDVKDDDEAAA